MNLNSPKDNQFLNGKAENESYKSYNTIAIGKRTTQTMIYQALHRKLQIEPHEPTRNQRMNSRAPEVAKWSGEK
jgi:hypothetical protein